MEVSVIVPCRNEREHVSAFLGSVLAQELPVGCEMEVLIADGRSDDGTRALLDEFSRRHPNVKVIDNPEGFVSHGLNRAIRAATGEVIIRMDVHTLYAPDYIRQCLEALDKTGADNVGGPARTRARGYLQEAIRLAYHSPFAVGGARFHDIEYEGPVDTVTYGCWRKATLERLGLFDEDLIRNQDDELNLRTVRAGGTVWQTPFIRSWYYPRDTLSKLFIQYMQYGYWKVRVIQKHRLPASIRHVVPGGFVLALTALAVSSVLWPQAGWLLAGLLALYGAATLAASLHTCASRGRWRFLPVMPAVFAAYHFGYGIGFVRGVLDFVLLRRRGAASFTRITRGRESIR